MRASTTISVLILVVVEYEFVVNKDAIEGLIINKVLILVVVEYEFVGGDKKKRKCNLLS